MTESEFVEVYGEVIYRDFLSFMRGQTIGVVDGEPLYYLRDVNNYFAQDGERFFD